jgi:hypothetical protein
MRTTLMAAAVIRCWRCVFARSQVARPPQLTRANSLSNRALDSGTPCVLRGKFLGLFPLAPGDERLILSLRPAGGRRSKGEGGAVNDN